MKLVRLAQAMAVVAGMVGLGLGALPAYAQSGDTIVLKSSDGFTQLRGKLLDFDGSVYTIETVLGVIKVDAMQVNCEGDACPADLMFGAVFGIHGSDTIGSDLMPALIEGYADTLDAAVVTEVGQNAMENTLRVVHPDGREMAAIDLKSHGSASSYAALAGGQAEIGMSSRRARGQDVEALSGAGFPDPRETENEHVIAVDGLVVIVNQSNPIQAVTLEELALMFSGVVTNWSQLGGTDAPINLYARDADSGTNQTFESLVLRPYDVETDAGAKRFTSNTQLSDAVAGDPGAIGITGIAFKRAAKTLPIRQTCGILSYPTTFAMKTEEYPLSRRLYLYTPPTQIAAHARQIVEFAKSDEAQAIIADAGFVNQAVERTSINNQGARLIHALIGEEEIQLGLFRNMLTELRSAERLSTTFRFTAGTSTLDPKSLADARRLAEDLAGGAYPGKELLLVGFTDSVGQFELNRALAQRRAQVVETTIRGLVDPAALQGVALSAIGYGELSPVGCNTDAGGRSANRRVEVWLRDKQ